MTGESSLEELRLPEGFISHVLSLTSPKDTCRLSLVSRTFRSAADSDEVWEKFLPKGYRNLLLPAMDQNDVPFHLLSKRELYFHLCTPTLFDGGRQIIVLEKSTGKACFMLSSRKLYILRIEIPQHWVWTSFQDSRFGEVAELRNVRWLEIKGKFNSKVLSPKTTYVAYILFKLRSRNHGLCHPFQKAFITVGENKLPTETVSLFYSEEGGIWQRLCSFMLGGWHDCHMEERLQSRMVVDMNAKYTPRARKDGWMETVLGEFFIDDGDEEDVLVTLRGFQGCWKGGLLLEGIEVRPKRGPCFWCSFVENFSGVLILLLFLYFV